MKHNSKLFLWENVTRILIGDKAESFCTARSWRYQTIGLNVATLSSRKWRKKRQNGCSSLTLLMWEDSNEFLKVYVSSKLFLHNMYGYSFLPKPTMDPSCSCSIIIIEEMNLWCITLELSNNWWDMLGRTLWLA